MRLEIFDIKTEKRYEYEEIIRIVFLGKVYQFYPTWNIEVKLSGFGLTLNFDSKMCMDFDLSIQLLFIYIRLYKKYGIFEKI